MKINAFLFSLLLFLWYIKNQHRGQSRAEAVQRCPRGSGSRAEEQKPQQAQQKRRTAAGGAVIQSQLKTLYSMRREAIIIEGRAQSNLDHIRELNQYGAVVNAKTEEKAQNALLLAQRRKLAIENQIRAAEKAATA